MPENRSRQRQNNNPSIELKEILARENDPDYGRLGEAARADLQLRKWRSIHKYLHDNPFHVREALPRQEQWRRVLAHLKDATADKTLLDWLAQQLEIAANLASGIQDLRPRKNGPCYGLVLEFVANQKRKALAVMHWLENPKSTRYARDKDKPAERVNLSENPKYTRWEL